jgi:hypothetical protein
VDELVELFGPHQQTLCSCVEAGATVRLVVVGDLGADFVDNVGDAEKRGYGFEPDEPFSPFLDSDRVVLAFDATAVRFLASVSASLKTHIDVELDGGT